MTQPVVRGVSYFLFHAPDLLVHNGTTQTLERGKDPHSAYLRRLPGQLRPFADVVAYPPNQAYIGNLPLQRLAQTPRPWYEQPVPGAGPKGKRGDIVGQDELYGWMKLADAFDLVLLTPEAAARAARDMGAGGLAGGTDLAKVGKGTPYVDVEAAVATGASPLTSAGRLVGCVKRAHELDPTLTAHIMLENLAAKATAIPALRQLLARYGLAPADVEYCIECSEEACGDMNQRGGGNFAKAIAELAGCIRATGSDVRAFCAAPAHAVVYAAALVKAGVYRSVAVVAGGSVAKLGMNGKDHVAKGLPVLEDVLGAFALLVTEDDGVNPIIRTESVGRHMIGSGASPQAVVQALVTEPLDRLGLKLTSVDKYAVELQNPEITEPAGAGNVPLANYKLIAALGVKRGELERAALEDFTRAHGLPGFAPTQGHIPSGIPYLGEAWEGLRAGRLRRVMIIGKGSLFLGRMTSQFDGVSFLLERNHDGKRRRAEPAAARGVRVGLTILPNEAGAAELVQGAQLAAGQGVEVVLIGPRHDVDLPQVEVTDAAGIHRRLEVMLDAGELDAGVTLHYTFPTGVSTVGRVPSPARGRQVFIATTTGLSATDRVEALVRNAVYGIIAAKAAGIHSPTVGVLNVDGARAAERRLKAMAARGYPIAFAGSMRVDGGAILRGNDVLTGSADVVVTDSLSGNVLMKLLSAFTTGGDYEAVGHGYGPGIGDGQGRIVCILSRASGAPVVAGAIAYAASLARGNLPAVAAAELARAQAAGLAETEAQEAPVTGVQPPPRKAVTREIAGIDVLELDRAVETLWREGIYAATGMGCTGPVVMVAEADEDPARQLLSGYITGPGRCVQSGVCMEQPRSPHNGQ